MSTAVHQPEQGNRETDSDLRDISGEFAATFHDMDDLCGETMREDWLRLTTSGKCAEPFYTQEWFSVFRPVVAKSGAPVVLTVKAASTVVGLLPLTRERRFFGKIPARTLRGLSNIHSCRFDLIHDGSANDRVAAAAWEGLKKRSDWDVIEVFDVPSGGNFEALMQHAEADGAPVGFWPTRRMPYLSIAQDREDPFKYCPERFKGSRSRLRSKENKLKKEGELTFELTTEANDAVLADFFRLEASGWKGSNGSAIGRSPELIELYSAIAKMAERHNMLRIYSMLLGGRPIAMHFGLEMNGVYYIPKVAYDEEYKKNSPGLLLVRHVIEDLAARGVQRFDFLGPFMEWKAVWTAETRQHSNCYIFRPGVKGRMLRGVALQLGTRLRQLKYRISGDPQEV